MHMLFWSVGGVLLLWFLVKRLIRRRDTFEEFRTRHAEQHARTVAALRKESGRLSAGEAMEPVIAGMREMFESEPGCSLLVRDTPQGPLAVLRLARNRHGGRGRDTAGMKAAGYGQAGYEEAKVEAEEEVKVEVAWMLRRAQLHGGQKDVRRGHFEVRLEDSRFKGARPGVPRTLCFDELADLMLFLREIQAGRCHPARNKAFFD